MVLINKDKQDWLDAHKNESVHELCRKDAFKTTLPWVSTRGMAKNTPEYRAAQATQDAYQRDEWDKSALFNFKLALDSGLDKYPDMIHDTVYALAWERGHSAGFSEIAICYDDLVEKFKEVYNLGVMHGKVDK